MIPVVVRVEHISDRLVRRLPNLGKNLADSPRGVRIDQHYVVSKDHPTCVCRLPTITVALPGEDARCKLSYSPRLAFQMLCQGDKQQRSKHAHDYTPSHGCLQSPSIFTHSPSRCSGCWSMKKDLA